MVSTLGHGKVEASRHHNVLSDNPREKPGEGRFLCVCLFTPSQSMAVISGRIVAALLIELRSCVKVDVAVLGSPSLIVLTVSVDVKQH